MIEILSITAAIFELLGAWLLSVKNRIGWLSFIVSGICWVSYSLITHSTYGLLIVCPIALFININGFRNWGKNDKANE